jgi:hypothetical protein
MYNSQYRTTIFSYIDQSTRSLGYNSLEGGLSRGIPSEICFHVCVCVCVCSVHSWSCRAYPSVAGCLVDKIRLKQVAMQLLVKSSPCHQPFAGWLAGWPSVRPSPSAFIDATCARCASEWVDESSFFFFFPPCIFNDKKLSSVACAFACVHKALLL